MAKFSRQSIGSLLSAVMSVMHGIELIGQLKYAVLERDGQASIVPRWPALDGVVPVAHGGWDGVGVGALARATLSALP